MSPLDIPYTETDISTYSETTTYGWWNKKNASKYIWGKNETDIIQVKMK